MFRSLRARLLVWFTAVMLAAVAGFGALVAYSVWRARLADIDAALAVRADALARSLRPAADGTFDLALATASVEPAGPVESAAFYHAIWTPDGAVIDRSDADWGGSLPPPAGVATRHGRRELTRAAASGAVVLAGRDLSDVRGDIWRLAASMGAIGLVAAVGAALGGSLIASAAVKPLWRVGETARAMTAGDFDARVPVDRIETELGQVAHALNGAFDQLQAALARQRRFTADASHELRTPLATISTEAQWTLARERTPEEYRTSLEAMQRAAARMQNTVDRLLALARAEARADVPEHVAFDDTTRAAVADVASIASRKGVALHVDLSPVRVVAPGGPLRDAVTNVVANAVQYTPPGGRVDIRLTDADGRARLAVRDTGVGIRPEHLPRIFEPFFRGDPARSGEGHGAGLGLAVARAVVTAAHGDMTCTSAPGQGTTIEILLPSALDGPG